MKNWVKDAMDRAKKEMDELERIDPILRRKLEAEAQWGRDRLTADQRADDPRKGQGSKR